MALTRTLAMPLGLPGHGRHVASRPFRSSANPFRALLGGRRPRFLRGPRLERTLTAPVIITERLKLRPHQLRDADEWYAIQSNPRVLRHIDWPPRDRSESRRHLLHRTRHTRLLQSGDFLALAVLRDDRLIGDVSQHLRAVEPENRSAEIGWVFDPEVSGHGYATEASRAMLKFAFTELGARTVTARIRSANRPSIALAERLGFVGASDGTTWALDAADATAVRELRQYSIVSAIGESRAA